MILRFYFLSTEKENDYTELFVRDMLETCFTDL